MASNAPEIVPEKYTKSGMYGGQYTQAPDGTYYNVQYNSNKNPKHTWVAAPAGWSPGSGNTAIPYQEAVAGNSASTGGPAEPYIISPSTTPSATTLRWPDANNYTVNAGTDYVYFEFGKYQPPFARSSNDNSTGADALAAYNASATAFKADEGSSIILPMPQDLSTEFKNTWAGKSFTSLGRAAVAALGAGNLGPASKIGENDIFGAFTAAISAAGLNKLPGVGGNLDMDDITGSSRGVILNPNAEVLYEAPNLREIGMVFKMVPQSQTEADNILKICQLFRKSASPSYGIEDVIPDFKLDSESGIKPGNDQKGVNYIHVPKLCKFTFMTGGGVNSKVAQYKPCAMTRVDVNYTPDGTFATYSDGTPVAITLSVSFMETKVIFANEINLSGVSF